MPIRLILAAVASACVAACGGSAPSAPPSSQPANDEPWFVERAEAAGIDFVHFNGMSGEFYYPEIMAPGVGLIDFDNDGDLDLYLVQGQMLSSSKKPKTIQDALFPPKGPLRDRVFRNDLTVGSDGRPTLRFTEVTEETGINRVVGLYQLAPVPTNPC